MPNFNRFKRTAEPQLGPAGPCGWHERGYLPHLDHPDLLQAVTFRLADSLPREKLAQLHAHLSTTTGDERAQKKRARIESWLNAGYGCCALAHPAVAAVTRQTLLRFAGDRYHLLAWCIMPNHVHVLLQPIFPLARIVQSWKAYTGRWAKQRDAELGLGVPPDKPFWMRDYFDRFVRNERHRRAVVEYIHQNPVKAGLCAMPCDWPWSSARTTSF